MRRIRIAFRRGKRGSATDTYLIMLVVTFLFLGAYALIAMNGAYRLDNPNEGIGFRQAAILQTYAEADNLLLYAETVGKYATQEAIHTYLLSGLKPMYGTTEMEAPCGYIGGYVAWNGIDEKGAPRTCYPFVSESEVTPALAQHLREAIEHWWQDPILPTPPIYRFFYQDGTIIARTDEKVLLPILGIKDDYAGLAEKILAKDGATLVKESFSAEPDIAGVVVVPDTNRELRAKTPKRILLTNILELTADKAQENLLGSDHSVHYLIGKDGKIIQMAKELEKVSLSPFGESAEEEKSEGYESKEYDDAIVIGLVNLGWHDEQLRNENPVEAKPECPDRYKAAKICKECEPTCWSEYPSEQLEALKALVQDIQKRWNASVEEVDEKNPGPLLQSLQTELLAAHEPTGATPEETQEAIAKAGLPGASGEPLLWPTDSKQVSSCFGYREVAGKKDDMHDGIDIPGTIGSPVYSVGDGTVYEVCDEWVDECACSLYDKESPCTGNCKGRCGNYGNYIIIKHDDDLFTQYSHLESVRVKKGAKVRGGDTIATLGKTGASYGAHLDLKVYTAEGDLHTADTAKNAFCFFDDSVLSQVIATPSASSCSRKYRYDGRTVMDSSNPTLVKECAGIDFDGLEPDRCLPAHETFVNFKSDAQNVETTRQNLVKYKGADLTAEIMKACHENNIDPAFQLAIITQESKGVPSARSPTGAIGIAQFTAATGGEYGLKTTKCCISKEVLDSHKCHLEGNYKCFPGNDERFDPVKSIHASAEMLGKLLKKYKGYKDKYYFAAAEYNSGAGPSDGKKGLKYGITHCASGGKEPRWDCVKAYVRKEGSDYGDKVLKHMAAWGGAVPGISTDLDCEEATTKMLGSLLFEPNFAVKITNVLEPLTDLVKWVEQTIEKSEDNAWEKFQVTVGTFESSSTPLNKALKDKWDLSIGFCEEDPYTLFLYRIVMGLRECEENQQRSCTCSVMPEVEDLDLQEGSYELVFQKNGRIGILKHDKTLQELGMAAFHPLTYYYFATGPDSDDRDVKEMDQIRFNFTISKDGGKTKITQERVTIGLLSPEGKMKIDKIAEHNPVGFTKFWEDYLFALYDVPSDDPETKLCLPTKRLVPVCAEGANALLNDENGAEKPVLKFGVTLRDTTAPPQITGLVVNKTKGRTDALELKFNPYNTRELKKHDVSGFMIYCIASSDDGAESAASGESATAGESVAAGDIAGGVMGATAPSFPENYYEDGDVYPVRVLVDEMKSPYYLTLCNNKPIDTQPIGTSTTPLGGGTSYTVSVHAFDLGGNENTEDVPDGNLGSYIPSSEESGVAGVLASATT